VQPKSGEIEALKELAPPPLADASTRAALWQDAGIVRSAEGLTRLLENPHPLARLIGRCALARTESRGAHRRLDHPDRDPSLDHRHVLVSGDEQIRWETWD
jgi:L-aspartate oxidase